MRIAILVVALSLPSAALADTCDDAKKAEAEAKRACAAAKPTGGATAALACGKQALATLDRKKAC